MILFAVYILCHCLLFVCLLEIVLDTAAPQVRGLSFNSRNFSSVLFFADEKQNNVRNACKPYIMLTCRKAFRRIKMEIFLASSLIVYCH